MAAGGILNMDVRAVGALVADGVHWWLDEMRQLLGARRSGPGGGPGRRYARTLQAEPLANGGFRFWREGETVPAPATDARARCALVLPAALVLRRELDLPPLTARDLRRLVTLDLDRLSPVPADQVYAALTLLSRDPERGRQQCALAVVRRKDALVALDRARAAGLEPIAVGTAAPAPGTGLDHDFTTAMREAGALPRSRVGRWWAAFAVLVALNLLVAIVADIRALDRVRGLVEMQAPVAATVDRVQARVLAEDRRRHALARRRLAGEPLRVLAALTATVPGGAWVQRLSWDGRSVRLVGYKRADVDLLAALRRSPLLANVRSSSPDVPPGLAAGQPYDITADVRPPVPLADAAEPRP